MQIYEYPGENRIDGKCVLALGFFDGVHIAHRDLIKTARKIAEEKGLPLGIFTFTGDVKGGAERIYSDREKNRIFESLGADFTVYADFAAIKDLSPEEFVKNVLVSSLGCAISVAGFNFRFGRGASGDAESLTVLMAKSGGEAVIKNEITQDGETVSSTRIRDLLTSGRMKEATSLLGAPYYIIGRVEHGNKTGRTLGFPTVNLPLVDGAVTLKRGVYRSAVPIGEKIYHGITNIGTCPTFDERSVHSETYILDFEGDIYGEEICIYLLDFMREEIAFSTPNDLKMQINIDKNRAIKENGDITWQELGLK